MKKKFYILMCLASLVLMVTACGGKEKIKEKLRAATEAVKERKEAAASEKGSDLEMDKQGDRPDNGAFVDPSLTPAQRKALDKENPWFARNFRMELTAKSMGNKVNVEIQKSGKILYYHFWNNSGNVETLILLDEGDYKIGNYILLYTITKIIKGHITMYPFIIQSFFSFFFPFPSFLTLQERVFRKRGSRGSIFGL